MKIQDFKIGDIITRIQPSKITNDRSYIGDEILLMNIENACIYYYRHDRFFSPDTIHKVPLYDWEDGWEYYKNPTTNYDPVLELIDIKVIETFLRKKKLKKVSE